MGEIAKLHLPSHCLHYHLNHPCPSLVEKLSSMRPCLVPKRLGTIGLENGKIKIKSVESSGRCLQKFAGQLLGLLIRSNMVRKLSEGLGNMLGGFRGCADRSEMYRIKEREKRQISLQSGSQSENSLLIFKPSFRLQSHLTCMIASDCHNKGMLCIAIAVLFTAHLRAWMAERRQVLDQRLPVT